ncbi:MAG: hypothetical protein AB1782_10295 [Cyanobacteriota bacterium]
MKIQKIDKNKIIIYSDPILMFVMGAIFFVVGLLALCAFMQTGSLECVRNASLQECRYSHSSLLGTSTNVLNLDDIVEAELTESSDSEGGSTYNVLIKTKNSSFSLTAVSTSDYSQKNYIASQINNFIQDKKETHLLVEDDPSLFPAIICSIFIVAGIMMIVMVAKIAIYIDKNMQQLTLVKKSLISKTMQTYNFGEIDEAYVDESDSSDSTVYRVVLTLNNDKELPLTLYYSSGYSAKKELADTINYYLEVFSKEDS